MTIKIEEEDGSYKEYESFDALFDAWDAQEKLWPWWKKAYYAWRRGPLWPSKIWYWLKCHTTTKYHMLDMRNRFYDWGWQDRCDLLLYASFNLLCEFIEEEKPPKSCDIEDNEHWDRAYREMWLLYDWWKNVREKDSDTDQEMLKRLVEIRGFLWT